MSLIMQPMPAEGGFGMLTGQGNKAKTSFSSHFGHKLEEIVSGNSDKFGLRTGPEEITGKNEEQLSSLLQSGSEERSENENAAAILSLFLKDLQSVARQKDMGPGEWVSSITDSKALEKLALEAGMAEGQLEILLEESGEKGASLNVIRILESLDRHLSNFEEGRIAVSDTRLPILETLLSKMGLESSRITEIAASALRGDNQLELNKFLQELQDINPQSAKFVQGNDTIKLSEWETRQLFDLLAEAGVDRSLRNKLLPELNLKNQFNQAAAKEDGPEIFFNLERLKTILEAGVANVRNKQPEINIPRFLVDMEKILGQAKFDDKSSSWSKVVQKTVDSLFKDIQKMVDMAKIQVGKTGGDEDDLLLNGLLRQSGEKGRMYGTKWFSSLYESKEEIVEKGLFRNSGAEQKPEFWTDLLTLPSNKNPRQQSGTGDSETLFINQPAKADNQMQMPVLQNSRIIARSPQQLQEQVMQQISSGVMRGLENRQHSLVLRLYPPEMGEVKVNLQVRNDHVSVTFNMDNPRVKEILEGSMQNFKDSMGQKGFSLDECEVFVGQEGSSGEKGQFGNLFQAATGEREGDGGEEQVPAADGYVKWSGPGNRGEDEGISLIV